jgi:malonate transporter and related proteins
VSDLLQLSVPIFAVVALGWVATRAGLSTPAIVDALGAYSFRFALPALVVQLIADQPLNRSFNPSFYAGYLVSGGVVFACMFCLSRLRRHHNAATAAAHATTGTVSNLGFLGPPLVLAIFGPRGAGPLAMAILAEVMVLLSVGSVIMGSTRAGGASVGHILLRGTVLNPVVTAIALGAALAAIGADLPVPADRSLDLLGASAPPTALFALGGGLALQRLDHTTAASAITITAAKLVAYPALVWCVLAGPLQLGAFWVQTGVLIASLPAASTTYVVAHRNGTDHEAVSAGIALSTVISVVTVPVAAWILLHGAQNPS